MNEMILFGAVVAVVFGVRCDAPATVENCRQETVHCAIMMPQEFNLCDRTSNSITQAHIELYRAVVNLSMVLKADDFCVYHISLQNSELSSLSNTQFQEMCRSLLTGVLR